MKKKSFFLNQRLEDVAFYVSFIGCLLGPLAGCKKTSIDVQKVGSQSSAWFLNKNIKEYITSDSSLKTFSYLLTRSGLDSLLIQEGPYSVFAPSDSAFEKAGYTPGIISNLTTDQITALVKYHIVLGRVTSANEPFFAHVQVNTLNTAVPAFYLQNNFGVFLNGVKVGVDYVALSNGAVYILNGVLNVPSYSLYDLVQTRTNLKIYGAFLNFFPNLTNALIGGGITSILAPTDSAFKAQTFISDFTMVNTTNIPINSAAYSEFNVIIFRSFLQRQVFVADLYGGATVYVATLSPGTPTAIAFFSSQDGTSVRGGSDASIPGEIVEKDLMALDGSTLQISNSLIY